MDFLFSFDEVRTKIQAFLFYIAHVALSLLMFALLGLAFANNYEVGSTLGRIGAILYCCALATFVIYQRRLPIKYYGSLVLVILASAALGVIAGLTVPAYLATKGEIDLADGHL